MQALADIWREISRHHEVEEALARIAPIVDRVLPLRTLGLRRLDPSTRRLWTVAWWPENDETVAPRTELRAEDLAQLVAWLDGGEVAVGGTPTGDAVLRLTDPMGGRRGAVALPLRDERTGAVGIALLQPASSLRAIEDQEFLAALQEPLRVALGNDRRIEELNRLKEAAEADKSALLSRLGRQEIAEVIVGHDGGLRDVMLRVEQVAPTDVPVLILGETGSGKEVIARAVHSLSKRPRGPMLRVNCGAIPPDLIDAELFGHEKGSFTGAVNMRQGWFERADGGTLFLDEVGELPLAAQVRLLRVLQDGSFERVGGTRPIACDVRIVAATHRNLEEMVAEGTFREDLWFRLSVFFVRLPALRERHGDLPLLAEHLAEKAGRRLGGFPLRPTPQDIALLRSYDWPGNVRELAAVIDRAAILGNGRVLEVAAALGMSQGVTRTRSVPSAAVPAVAGVAGRTGLSPAPTPKTGRARSLNAAVTEHIVHALQRTQGRIEGPLGAAALLDVNPHTLRSRMRKLGIDWSGFRPTPSDLLDEQNDN